MEIYTSYFGNLRKLSSAGIVPVSIARWDPKRFEGISYKTVAPLPEMLRNDITNEQYTLMYQRRILSNLNPGKIVRDLHIMTGGKDCALLCYEKPGDFCHRHLLADWMLKETGLVIQEFGLDERKKEVPAYQEPTLF